MQQSNHRHLAWDACYNARDLGGLPTSDGGETRWRAVIRSDLLSRLTPDGQQALGAYGVRTIIDLRGPGEVQAAPYGFVALAPGAGAPTYLNLPFERHSPYVRQLISSAETRAAIYCIVLDYYPSSITTVMRAIAKAQAGGVVVHCHSGKDRTGLIAALLLGVAGVPMDVIADDYAESQRRLWPLYEQRVAEVGSEAADTLRPTATADTMQATLAHLERRYQSIRGYLIRAGMTETEIAQLRQRLR